MTMGFMDELRKLTQPYDDEDDFFEGADSSPRGPAAPGQRRSRNLRTPSATSPRKARTGQQPRPPGARSGGLGALGVRKIRRAQAPAAPRQRTVNFGGNETQVILFNPKTFDEAGELVSHLQQGRSVVMTLEGVPTDNARRLLDFLSGITFALQGKITPVSAKTYFVTPQNVDLVGSQADQPESDGQYF